MATLLQVYNAAASHASVGPALTSENDPSPVGEACRTHFYPLFDALLHLGAWPWATRRRSLSAKTLYQPTDSRYRGTDGYIVFDQAGLSSNTYRYEIPQNHYGYGDAGFAPDPGNLDRVRPFEVVRAEDTSAQGIDALSGPADDQARWLEEGPDLISSYTDTPKPAADDPDRGAWMPQLTLRFIASVQVPYASGPFVESLEAFLGAVLARKFREQQQAVQDLLAYAGTQLQLALQTLPDPVNYDAITFFTPLSNLEAGRT